METIALLAHEITEARMHFGDEMPVLFLQTTDESAAQLRQFLGMLDPEDLHYYDPKSERKRV